MGDPGSTVFVCGPRLLTGAPRVICDLHNERWAPRAGAGGARGNLPLTHTRPVPSPFFTPRAQRGCRAERVRETLQLQQTERLKLGFRASSTIHLSKVLIFGLERAQRGRGVTLYS